MPPGFTGAKKSFSVCPDGAACSLGILWHESQIYVNRSCSTMAVELGLKVNGKGGTTISVRKVGGWLRAWKMACACAGLQARHAFRVRAPSRIVAHSWPQMPEI